MRPVDLKGISGKRIMELSLANKSMERAAKRLAELGIPDRKSEEYRYFDIEPLMEKEWEPAVKRRPQMIERAHRLVITDGMISSMPEGLEVGCSDTLDLDVSHFDPMYYFGHLFGGDILQIRVKRDMKLEIKHIFTQPGKLLTYRVAIYADANIKLGIYESFEAEEAKNALIVSGIDLFAARDSRVALYKDQTLFESDYTPLFSYRFKIDGNAEVKFASFDMGSGNGLQTLHAQLHENSSILSDHLLYAVENARRGTVSKFVHIGRSSQSRQRAKSILADRARGIFDALIKVEHSGKYTKAHQNSKAVLLDSGAYMASKPQLEIYIDDLEASHGSTTGQLDEKELFYLRSRGIAYEEAKKMLILAFANEIIDSIDDENIKERIHSSFEYSYYGKNIIECIQTCHGCEKTVTMSQND